LPFGAEHLRRAHGSLCLRAAFLRAFRLRAQVTTPVHNGSKSRIPNSAFVEMDERHRAAGH
jgi:hypothetical protein